MTPLDRYLVSVLQSSVGILNAGISNQYDSIHSIWLTDWLADTGWFMADYCIELLNAFIILYLSVSISLLNTDY